MVLGLFHPSSVQWGFVPAGQRGTHITATPVALPAGRALPQHWPGAACQEQLRTSGLMSHRPVPCGTALEHSATEDVPGSAINSPQQGEHSLNALPTLVTDFSSPAFTFSEPCLEFRFYSR